MKPVLFLLALVVLAVPACRAESAKMDTLQIVSADGAIHHDFKIEIADTPETRTIGMMFREKIKNDFGMLFIFDEDEERDHFFWMKNTLIPLDIVFIRKDGKINHIHPNAVPEDLTSIPSQGPIFSVLEIKGGRAEKLGLQPGDIVHHSVFGNALAK